MGMREGFQGRNQGGSSKRELQRVCAGQIGLNSPRAQQQHDLHSHPEVPLGTGLMGIQPGTVIWDHESSGILNKVGAPGLELGLFQYPQH